MDETAMTTMRSWHRYWKNECGASAAEFTLVVIPFMVLIFGIIGLSMMFYANQTLHYATEAAARCFAVNVTSCPTTGATQTYALGRYSGPNISPVFVATTVGCGHTVTGAANFPINVVVVSINIPLAATACFP
jgi:Flp pilus assembly pilin Flp